MPDNPAAATDSLLPSLPLLVPFFLAALGLLGYFLAPRLRTASPLLRRLSQLLLACGVLLLPAMLGLLFFFAKPLNAALATMLGGLSNAAQGLTALGIFGVGFLLSGLTLARFIQLRPSGAVATVYGSGAADEDDRFEPQGYRPVMNIDGTPMIQGTNYDINNNVFGQSSPYDR